MTHEKLVAAYDFGTSGAKLAFVNLEGNVRHVSSGSYSFCTPQLGWAEMDPGVYWDTACVLMQRLLAQSGVRAEDIAAIVFGTIWKGIIPISKDGRVLCPSMLWLDGRAHAQAEALNARFGENIFHHKDYWSKLYWLKQNRPDVFAEAAHILDFNAFLKWKATGEISADLANHYTRSFDGRTQAFYDAYLQYCGIDAALFPPITDCTDLVGQVTSAAVACLGVSKGTPVYGGCTDVMAIPVGAGATCVGDSHIYLGTSGWFGQITPVAARVHPVLAAPFCREADVSINGINAACSAIDWAIARFYAEERRTLGDGVYPYLETDLADIPAGSDRLLATNWLYGERPPVPEEAYAMFLNVTYRHDRRHFVHAMREACLYMLRWRREAVEQRYGHPCTALRAVGGGAKSAQWMQMLADVMQVPVETVAHTQHAGAAGVACCALIGMGVFSGFADARRCARVEHVYLPEQEASEKYERMYRAYLDVTAEMAGAFRILGRLEE